MSEPRYPILVERYEGNNALRIACQHCPWEQDITPDEIRNERNYVCPACGEDADYKYEEADHKCAGCGKLGFFSPVLNHCCSRACMLQAEWAATLNQRSSVASGQLGRDS